MRLINFAYGELIMAGAYSIFLLSGPPWYTLIPVSIATAAFFALVTERVAFRPIRGAGAPTLLVTSFAVSYLLQNIGLLSFGAIPRGVLLPQVVTEQFTITND